MRSAQMSRVGGFARRDRDGFALPLVVMALGLLLVIMSVLIFVSRQELRMGQAAESGTLAFYLAERGVDDLLSTWGQNHFDTLDINDSASVTDTLEWGEWTAVVRRLGEKLYLASVESTVTEGGDLLSGASRQVGLFVQHMSADISPSAALTARGSTIVGGNGEVHGADVSPTEWGGMCTGPLSDHPGILTDDSMNVSTRGAGVITGVPTIAQDTTISDETFTTFGSATWDDLVAMADKHLPAGTINQVGPVEAGGVCDVNQPLNWGDPLGPTNPCGDYFPIVHINGTAQMQAGGVGQGILLVEGDLDLRGNFRFFGMILVKGNMGTQGSGNRIWGGVMASNAEIDAQSITGGSEIQYSSCVIDRTMDNIAGLDWARPLSERGWVDLSSVLD